MSSQTERTMAFNRGRQRFVALLFHALTTLAFARWTPVVGAQPLEVIHPSVELRNFAGRVKTLRLNAAEIEALWESEGRSTGRPIGSVAGIVITPEIGANFRSSADGTAPQVRPIQFEAMLEGRPGPGARIFLEELKSPELNPLDDDSWVTIQPWLIDTEKDFQVARFGGNVFNDTRWPDGGIARFRVFVYIQGSPARRVLLQQADATGNLVYTRSPQGIVTDIQPDPSETGESFLNALDNRFPVFASDETGQDQQQAETELYYRSVKIEVEGQQRSILSVVPTLDAFREHYFNSGGRQYSARYYNRGDLGIGRDMHCIFNNSRRENACYVGNFAPTDNKGFAVFGSASSAKGLLARGARPFATVAMVERMDMPTDAAHHTFFVVYDANDEIATGPVRLDNVGYNTFVPGNCMVCHGGSGTYDRASRGLKGAYFLPFDMDAFEYLSDDSANPDSREGLHDAFRGMNEGILAGSFGRLRTAEMVRAWYSQGGAFDSLAPPPGWDGIESDRQLYQRVYAKACRTCHISQEKNGEDPGFSQADSWRQPSVYKEIVGDVCKTQKMPNAQQTLRVAWGDYPSARAYLLAHLGLTGGCAPLPKK